ncbi:TPA: hypothetical protein ROI55_006025 [Pseudomonas aeruginosa]|nr:hypothetical protein [Pseudomonas aeruginosa]HEQ0015320.1 hypothetical protein [Pseudomonas aeruginosa]HEQ0112426.1 hypothetical protein [Pseudomonas aeruginosa]HEQ0188152.1 hypothetical protein [Pseudomonas aeruginosa]HEQ0239308.1 hypothetical protein [Pseudomonas aeruginosa]
MLTHEPAPLELSQADAVALAELIDAELRSASSLRPFCLGCGRDIDKARLAVFAKARRCSTCAGIPCLARRRAL